MMQLESLKNRAIGHGQVRKKCLLTTQYDPAFWPVHWRAAICKHRVRGSTQHQYW
jgi:hypothetical protein